MKNYLANVCLISAMFLAGLTVLKLIKTIWGLV